MTKLPEIGETIIVQNIRYAKATVADVSWQESENRYAIHIHWQDAEGKNIGRSKVFSTDENKTWFRNLKNN